MGVQNQIKTATHVDVQNLIEIKLLAQAILLFYINRSRHIFLISEMSTHVDVQNLIACSNHFTI